MGSFSPSVVLLRGGGGMDSFRDEVELREMVADHLLTTYLAKWVVTGRSGPLALLVAHQGVGNA